jgi:hypothetical protein
MRGGIGVALIVASAAAAGACSSSSSHTAAPPSCSFDLECARGQQCLYPASDYDDCDAQPRCTAVTDAGPGCEPYGRCVCTGGSYGGAVVLCGPGGLPYSPMPNTAVCATGGH